MKFLQKCILLLIVPVMAATLTCCAKEQEQPPEIRAYMEQLLDAAQEALAEGWTTKTAAVCGGIRKVHEKYIGNFQHTPYFQKFNVHPGSSSNFWGQYMQDLSGALIGGRRAYGDYQETGNLEAAHRFVIPVYGQMPQNPCPDPANGLSYYSPSALPLPDA